MESDFSEAVRQLLKDCHEYGWEKYRLQEELWKALIIYDNDEPPKKWYDKIVCCKS